MKVMVKFKGKIIFVKIKREKERKREKKRKGNNILAKKKKKKYVQNLIDKYIANISMSSKPTLSNHIKTHGRSEKRKPLNEAL